MLSDLPAQFGYRVCDARTRKGWRLEDVARQALSNPDRRGHVSQIENGKIGRPPRTVGSLARVLELPKSVSEPRLRQPLPAKDLGAAEDRSAERLMHVSKTDNDVAPPAKALWIALAYRFARGTMPLHRGERGGPATRLTTAIPGVQAVINRLS